MTDRQTQTSNGKSNGNDGDQQVTECGIQR